MGKTRFETELIAGHGGVTAVIVPFDPESIWRKKPVRLDARRDGWLVKGTVNRVRFDGYIGCRWGRFFIIIDAELPKAPHELRERNLRIVNEMAGAASKPVVYISAMSIGFTEFTKALRKSLLQYAEVVR